MTYNRLRAVRVHKKVENQIKLQNLEAQSMKLACP